LLVEDNPADADLAREGLSNVPDYTFELTCVSHLREAIEVLQSSDMDLVLLDLKLPDSDGIETIRRIKQAKADVAIVVLSDHASGELRRLVLREGAQDFIGKSEPLAALISRIMPTALERHQAFKHHRQVENLVSATPDAVIVTDLDGVVQFANKAGVDLFSNIADLVGAPLPFEIHEGEISRLEVGSAEERRCVDIRVSRCDWARAPAFLVSIRETTEQVRLSERLGQAQRMEAMGLLAGGIAHDFNNLSLAILFNAEYLRDQYLEGDKTRMVLDEIIQAVDQASSLTRQLLAFSKRQPIAPRPLDLSSAVSGVLAILRRTLPENIVIERETDTDLWPVNADPGQMEQLVLNLAINARDAMPDGGRLKIALHNRVLERGNDSLPSGAYVALTVGDTGRGIPADLIERIFEPFFTTKGAGRGSGLGLATCYGIVERAQGRISVESKVADGSTFTVLLPRAKGAAPSQAAAAGKEEPKRGSATVLLVEDNVAVRSSMFRALEGQGYTVLTAGDGKEAIDVIDSRKASIDLVLSDVVMPNMNGYELSDLLAVRHPALKMVLMTGYSDLAAGRNEARIARPMIRKPCYKRDLFERIEETLAS
jgi:two-component system cell cycle sensor histidine kinase/response regulator CckA